MEVIKLYDDSVHEFVTLHGKEALRKLLDEMKTHYNNDIDSILDDKPLIVGSGGGKSG